MQKPTHLNPGDRVAIVSLSSGILGEEQFRHKYELAKCRLEKDYGLEVVPMQNALRGRVYLYRHPEARAADLMEAFNDPSIKAVFCAVGGNDTVRLLPYIDFETLHNHPKIFMGFSDTTVDHFMMNKAGLVSYYGPAVLTGWAEYGAINDYTREALDKTLFHPAAPLDIRCSSYCSYEHDRVAWDIKNAEQARPLFDNTGYELIQGRGTVSGPLLGGCIDVFPMVIGTAAWPSLDEWRGKLMLLETSERNISPEQLIELLRNLLAQGILHAVNGIVVGKPAYRDKYDAYKEIFKMVVGFEADCPDLPILYNVNVGHAYPIGVFALGVPYEINCDEVTLTLLEPATAD